MDNPVHKRNEEIGKYYFDLSKLSFVGLVIGTILELKDQRSVILIFLGSLLTIILGLLGNLYLKKNLRK